MTITKDAKDATFQDEGGRTDAIFGTDREWQVTVHVIAKPKHL